MSNDPNVDAVLSTRLDPADGEPEPVLKYFRFDHLPPNLRSVSRIFAEAAAQTILFVPRGEQRALALQRLLEAKDAAVRQCLP